MMWTPKHSVHFDTTCCTRQSEVIGIILAESSQLSLGEGEYVQRESKTQLFVNAYLKPYMNSSADE